MSAAIDNQADPYAYARRFLHAVPYDWTQARCIPVGYDVLETLAHAGDIEMSVVQLYTASQQPHGCIHRFRRVRRYGRAAA